VVKLLHAIIAHETTAAFKRQQNRKYLCTQDAVLSQRWPRDAPCI